MKNMIPVYAGDVAMVNPPTPRRYWAVTHALGLATPHGHAHVYDNLDKADKVSKTYPADCGCEVLEVAIIPAAHYVRLLAIEAAAVNALDNSCVLEYRDLAEDRGHMAGCTVLDDRDAAELREAVKDV